MQEFTKKNSTTLFEVRTVFDKVTELHPDTENQLNRKSIIVRNAAFVDAIVRLQRNLFYYCSMNEPQIVKRSHVQKEALIQEHSTMSLADKALHMFKNIRTYA